jgi:hypothetical protein
MRPLLRLCWLIAIASLSSGCSIILPEVSTMPVVHNPFPQLSRVAVTPFANLSDEPKVDGRQFALAYFAELQAVPGFEVVPLGVVEEIMIQERIALNDPRDVRRLGQLLGVDAVVVGAVTDYSPYYPPRCGMRVEWYATNPGFHKIPAGYGLPWGTPDEEYIPQKVVFDAEMALARAQMETQSPVCPDDAPPAMPLIEASPLIRPAPHETEAMQVPIPDEPRPPENGTNRRDDLFDESGSAHNRNGRHGTAASNAVDQGARSSDGFDIENEDVDDPLNQTHYVDVNYDDSTWRPQRQAAYKVPVVAEQAALAPDAIATDGVIDRGIQNNLASQLPPDWPDPHAFIPPGPSPVRPECIENYGPVMTHTRIFLGHDPEFTAALAAYVDFRDDARFGGWRSYLERPDDFIRFCCHLHISEMLSARGGATETRVVRHWSNSR